MDAAEMADEEPEGAEEELEGARVTAPSRQYARDS